MFDAVLEDGERVRAHTSQSHEAIAQGMKSRHINGDATSLSIERDTLLRIIGAMMPGYFGKEDAAMPSRAAKILEAEMERMGCKINAVTIADKFKVAQIYVPRASW